MDKLDQDAFLELFGESVRGDILAAATSFEATHVVCYENIAMDSPSFGERSALTIGPKNTLKTLEDTRGHWLNDLPSKRQYPRYYMEV